MAFVEVSRARIALRALAIVFVMPALIGVGAATPSTAAQAPVVDRAASRTAAEFFAPRALAGIECGMYSNGVHCQSERGGPSYFAQVAELRPNGSVTICKTRNMRSNNCDLGNAGERAATLAFGRRVTVGPFRCTMLRSGVRCTVLASGKGFLLTRTKLTSVGGAKPRVTARSSVSSSEAVEVSNA
jgi:hypothetical protein